jgi:hypothetical protein
MKPGNVIFQFAKRIFWGHHLKYSVFRVKLHQPGAVCMIISEVPFFYYAEPIVKRFGILCPGSKILSR